MWKVPSRLISSRVCASAAGIATTRVTIPANCIFDFMFVSLLEFQLPHKTDGAKQAVVAENDIGLHPLRTAPRIYREAENTHGRTRQPDPHQPSAVELRPLVALRHRH